MRDSLGAPVAILFGLLFGVMALTLSPAKALLGVVGLAAAVTILRFPLWGLLLFALIATFMPYSTINLGIRSTVSEAILALTWGAVLWQTFLSRLPAAPSLWRRPTDQMLLWLMLFSVFPFIVGQVIVADVETSGVANWLRWLLSLSAVFLCAKLLVEPKQRESLVVALLLGTLAMLVMSIAVFVRTRSGAGIAPILALLNYGNFDMLKFGGMTERGWRRALGLGVACLGAAALLLASSRGAMVSLALVLMWMAARRVPYTGRLLMIGAALTVALVLAYPPLQERLATIFSSDNASTEIRFDEYRMFPQAVAAYPFGIGFKVDPPVPGTQFLGISNLWLNFIYKTGIVGMLLFVAVTVRWWREARPERGPIRLTKDNALWLGSTAGILAALVSGLFDHYFSFAVVMVALFWLMVGLNVLEARRLFAARVPQIKTAAYRKPLPDGARP
ncbi:hypothetical protein AO260_29695 [Pseudomonas sp. ABAC21]|nr:hypothetical protein AO260_29695 [Pseudomonas sp. ABAC21]